MTEGTTTDGNHAPESLPASPPFDPFTLPELYVLTITHRHGSTTTSLHRTSEAAYDHLAAYVLDEWSAEVAHRAPPKSLEQVDDEAIAHYMEQAQESFCVDSALLMP